MPPLLTLRVQRVDDDILVGVDDHGAVGVVDHHARLTVGRLFHLFYRGDIHRQMAGRQLEAGVWVSGQEAKSRSKPGDGKREGRGLFHRKTPARTSLWP